VEAQEQGFIALGTALKQNIHNTLTELDLSCNSGIGEKGFMALGHGLQNMTHSLVKLNVACCDMNSRSAAHLITGLAFGKEVAKGLTEIDLSYNNISATGSVPLCNWFAQPGGAYSLKLLYLKDTKLDVGNMMRALKMGQVVNLEELDISCNRIDMMASQAVASLMESCTALKKLDLSAAGLPAQGACLILQAICANQTLRDFYLDLSNNELGCTRCWRTWPVNGQF
jgi:Ran GTPase-activating protein (RanGAP) involved in mRNA processing and transport